MHRALLLGVGGVGVPSFSTSFPIVTADGSGQEKPGECFRSEAKAAVASASQSRSPEEAWATIACASLSRVSLRLSDVMLGTTIAQARSNASLSTLTTSGSKG